MSVSKGQWVRHPKHPDWGVGQVMQEEGDCVRVLFRVGEQKVNQEYVQLERVEPPTGGQQTSFPLPVQSVLRMETIRTLCQEFYGEMTGNRSKTDDGGMALKVIEDLENWRPALQENC